MTRPRASSEPAASMAKAGARRAPLVRFMAPARHESKTPMRMSAGPEARWALTSSRRTRRFAQAQLAILGVAGVVDDEQGALAAAARLGDARLGAGERAPEISRRPG